tara:strand:- start:1858 stop:2130 length:273 start_codon:yes stop_codon:yes gene_type:complete
MAEDDWKKRLKHIQSERRKEKRAQGKPHKNMRANNATARGLTQSGNKVRARPKNNKKCSMCGKKVAARNQYESISGSPLCKPCAENRAGR